MIDFETAIKIAEEVLATLDKLYHLVHPATPGAGTANSGECALAVTTTDIQAAATNQFPITMTSHDTKTQLPNLLQFRRKLLAIHAKRHLVTELTATGKLTESEAQAMVDEGSSSPTTSPSATGGKFANILDWLIANGPAIEQDIAAAIPILISLITLFGG
jgi:hypothetical protein